jgi:hypothetical protein
MKVLRCAALALCVGCVFAAYNGHGTAPKKDRLLGLTVVKQHEKLGIVDGKITKVDKITGAYTIELNTEKKVKLVLSKADVLALLPKHLRLEKKIIDLSDPKAFAAAKKTAEAAGETRPLVVAFCETGKGGCKHFRMAFDETAEKLKVINVTFAEVEITEETREWFDENLGFMGKMEVPKMTMYRPGVSHGYDKSQGFSDSYKLQAHISGQFSAVAILQTADDIDQLMHSADVSVVGFFPPESNYSIVLRKYAPLIDAPVPFAICGSEEVAKEYAVGFPSVQLLKKHPGYKIFDMPLDQIGMLSDRYCHLMCAAVNPSSTQLQKIPTSVRARKQNVFSSRSNPRIPSTISRRPIPSHSRSNPMPRHNISLRQIPMSPADFLALGELEASIFENAWAAMAQKLTHLLSNSLTDPDFPAFGRDEVIGNGLDVDWMKVPEFPFACFFLFSIS